MELIGYTASILMGLSLGMIGGGGSILTVPILVYFFALPPVVATGYSLFVVGLTALVGGLNGLRRGPLDFKIVLIFAGCSFPGVQFTRGWVIPHLPDPVFQVAGFHLSKGTLMMAVFALLMILASSSMLRRMTLQPKAEWSSAQRYFTIALVGLGVGCVTGFVGAGGGFLIVPALVILVGLPMKKAVSTSLFIIAINSLSGFIGDLQRQALVDWTLLLPIAAIAISGIFLGTWASRFVAEDRLKKAFGWFVLVMGSGILLQQAV